jgi:hypothetical protein
VVATDQHYISHLDLPGSALRWSHQKTQVFIPKSSPQCLPQVM